MDEYLSMKECPPKDTLSQVGYVAQNTLEWRDADKLSFLWDNQVVLMHYNEDQNRYTLLTQLEPQAEKEVNSWLGENPNLLEETKEDEPSL